MRKVVRHSKEERRRIRLASGFGEARPVGSIVDRAHMRHVRELTSKHR